MAAFTFDEILKGNPYHDERGRFTTGPKAKNPMIRTDPPPQKTKIAYKVFVARDGKLYPPMVANPDGMDTPVGVWLDAAEGTKATDKDGNPITNTLGRNKVKAGGKGTQGGSGTLAYRPGWHLGELPEAKQFYTKDKETGEKKQKKNFVWAECEIAADFDYQQEAMSYGYNKNGKFQHSLAGLPKIPKDGYYTYRTNPDPTTQPWYITGSMKVNRILTDKETNAILRSHGIEPMKRDGGELDLKALGFTETNFVNKSMEDSRAVLFIGLKISGVDSLAIKDGEDPDDFHVTLAYGHFDASGRDEDDIACRVRFAVDQVKVGIPDKIRFDAIKRFKASESSDGKDVIYAQVAAGQLEEAHDFLLSMLKEKGIELEDTFPKYKPHMTLAYIDPGEEYKLSKINSTGTTTTVMIGHGWESTKENNYTIAKTFAEILKFNPYHDAKGRFATADGYASFTYAPGKSKAHDKAIAREKDRSMRKDFGDKIRNMADGLDMNDPKNCVAVGREVSKEIDRRFKAKKKAGEAEFDEPQSEDIYDVLKDVRSFGPGEHANKIVIGSDLDKARTKAIMDDALNRYPTDWYRGAYDSCGVMINDHSGRARHFVSYDGRSEVQVYARENPDLVKELSLGSDRIPNAGIANVVTHELGHYFERSNVSVGIAARSFYDSRTKNSEVTEMYPGEYTKRDRFADAYMGKVYQNGSTEITSVLSQKLGYSNPKQAITQDFFSNQKKDVQSYNFILGLLAGGGRS